MKGVIVYKGKYGATRQYAEWLAQELRLPLLSPEQATGSALANSDYVIAGSSVYVGKIGLKRWLKQYAEVLHGKKLFLFIVCATPTAEKEKLDLIRQANVPPVLMNQCAVYFLHGRVIKKNLSWFDRLILKMGAGLIKDQVAKSKILEDFDDVRKEHLIPLVKDVEYYTKGAQTHHDTVAAFNYNISNN